MTITIGITSRASIYSTDLVYEVNMWLALNGTRFNHPIEGKNNIHHAINSAFKEILELTGVSKSSFELKENKNIREWSFILRD